MPLLAYLCFEHPANRDGEAVFVMSCMIPRHVLIQTKLPSLEVVLPVQVPKTIEAGCEGNGPLDALVLRDHDDVGVPHLKWKFSRMFHLSEQSC